MHGREQGRMADAGQTETSAVPPRSEGPKGASVLVGGGQRRGAVPGRMDLLSDVSLRVNVEVGRAKLTIADIIALAEGSILPLDKLSGESVDICINNEKLARGEIIVIQDKMRVRVIDIVDEEGNEEDDADA